MYALLRALGSFGLGLLRLPFDLLFLGYDYGRLSLWLLFVRPLLRRRDPTNLQPLPQACSMSEFVRDEADYALYCGPARKYGSPWLYRLLCRWCTYREVTGNRNQACAICQCSTPFVVSPLRHALVGLILLAFYVAVGGVTWRVAKRFIRARAALTELTLPAERAGVRGARSNLAVDPETRRRAVEQTQAALALRGAGKTAEARLAFKAAVALDASNVAGQTGLAECAFELGMYPEAGEAIGQALQLDGSSASAYLTLARIEKAAGKPDAAREHAKRSLSLSPQNVEAMLLLGNCHLATGHPDDAAEQAKAVLALDPQNPGACVILGEVELARQNLAEAEKQYRRALDLDRSLPGAQAGLARVLRLRGQYSAAFDLVSGILASNPDSTEASAELAEVYAARGKLSAAVAVLRGLRERQPRYFQGRARLAELLFHSGKTNEGYRAAQDLLADEPGSIPAHIVLADAFLRRGFTALAIEHCRAALARNAGSVVAIKLLTRACIAAEEYQDGAVEIRRLVEQRPMDLEGKVLLATCYEGMGAKDKSIEVLEAAATAFPDSAIPLREMGTIYRRRGDPAAAAVAYDRALALASEDPFVLSSRAALLLESNGDKERALELALQASKLLPGNPVVADTLGWAYCQRGEYGKAMECLIYAAMQTRDDPAVRYHLGVALYGKGELAKARDQLQQALAMDQEFAAAPQASALLEKVRTELKDKPTPPAP